MDYIAYICINKDDYDYSIIRSECTGGVWVGVREERGLTAAKQ